jgi:hypothetical protein
VPRATPYKRSQGRDKRFPIAEEVLLFPKDDGSMWTRDEWGIENPTAPDGLYTRPQLVLANAAAATYTAAGIAAPTASATAANADIAEGPFVSHTSGAVIGNSSGLISAAFNLFRPGWYPRMRTLIRTPADIANYRLLAGFFSANPDAVPTTLHGAWLRYDTGVDGTAFWRAVTAAGASNAIGVTVTAKPITADTTFLLGIDFVPPDPYVRGQNPIAVKFTVATAAAEDVVAYHLPDKPDNVNNNSIPLANQQLGYGVRVATLVALAKRIDISRLGFVTP